MVQEIEHEVHRIEELLNELIAHPSDHLDFEHHYQILTEHEKKFAEELRRIEKQH